jgi:hypothetical protein
VRAERGMGRARTGQGRRWTAWLAIAGLLLQLGMFAGHFHAEDFGFLPGHEAGAAVSAGGTGAPWPAHGQPGAPGHDDCALCLTLHLAGSAPLPDIPAPAPAPVSGVRSRPHPKALRLAAAPYLLFRTRAPPRL